MLVTTLERRLAVAPHWKRDYFILRELMVGCCIHYKVVRPRHQISPHHHYLPYLSSIHHLSIRVVFFRIKLHKF